MIASLTSHWVSAVNNSPPPGIVLPSLSPASSCCAFKGTHIPVLGRCGCGKDCLTLIPFGLSQVSCFTQPQMFLLCPKQLPRYGSQTSASVPPPAKGTSSPANSPLFSPASFILSSFVWFYIFFSGGQILLPALSWCSARFVSEGLFLMYLWREMYSRPSTPLLSCSPP